MWVTLLIAVQFMFLWSCHSPKVHLLSSRSTDGVKTGVNALVWSNCLYNIFRLDGWVCGWYLNRRIHPWVDVYKLRDGQCCWCYCQANFSALHLAAQNGHNQTARFLLYAGCSAEHKNNVSTLCWINIF